MTQNDIDHVPIILHIQCIEEDHTPECVQEDHA